ncbi:acyltransferase [Sulfurimonas sp. HSL-3221]|uniref:acyltransferase n=1 Tax=Sulfurimonadaceae TaxID=2771471 RepID=UPI001E467BF5|nr:acyltransferase [Sulfurimonas sp. HSL-3221]UFS62407.1 acyltransferase [Sulfurimonas sp. HSL-3221]
MTYFEKFIMRGGVAGLISLVVDRMAFYGYKRRYYQKSFMQYGENVRWGKHALRLCIPSSVRISNPQRISIGNNCQFDEYVYLQSHHEGEGLFLGNGVRINAFTHIQSFSRVVIGDFVLVAPFCHINSGNHGTEDAEVPIMHQRYKKAGEISIGRGVWMGRNSQVLGGVQLGKNCIVAAGAVVTKSFPEHTTIGGVPANVISDKRD